MSRYLLASPVEYPHLERMGQMDCMSREELERELEQFNAAKDEHWSWQLQEVINYANSLLRSRTEQ